MYTDFLLTPSTHLYYQLQQQQQQAKPVREINLAPGENYRTNSIPPISVYLGGQIYIDTKTYRNTNYLCFYKREPGSIDVKNRFNVPVAQISTLRQALDTIEEHFNSSGK